MEQKRPPEYGACIIALRFSMAQKKGGPQAAAIDMKEIYFWEKNSVIARIM